MRPATWAMSWKVRSDAHFAIEGQLDFKRLGGEVGASLEAIEEVRRQIVVYRQDLSNPG